MKKLMVAVGSVGGSVAAFAEDPAITTPDGILTAAQTALENLITAALPIVGAIVVAGLTIWGAMKLLGLIKKAFGFGTGR